MASVIVVAGSVRRDRHGIKVARWIAQKLEDRSHTVDLVDPAELDLPMLDKMYKEIDDPPEKLRLLGQAMAKADGYIPVTPEYNHGVSSALKNTLDYFLEEYFFKPSAIVSYSVGGFGGNLAGAQLRQIMAELGAPAIPSSLAISRVAGVFGEDGVDEKYEARAARFLDEFEWYMEALKKQRAAGTPY